MIWRANELEPKHGVGSSKITYASVAPLIGLDPIYQMRDIPTFEVHRSRIPTHLFKAIVMDMDDMLIQYGPPFEHETEESRSRFLSPVRIILFSLTSLKKSLSQTIRLSTT